LLNFVLSDATRVRICPKHFLYRFKFSDFGFFQNFFNYLGDLVEPDSPLEKRRHRDFVGGIECNRFRTACLNRFIGQAQTRKLFHIRRSEVEVS